MRINKHIVIGWLKSLSILTFVIWLWWNDAPAVFKEYNLIVGDKREVQGEITKASGEQEFIETDSESGMGEFFDVYEFDYQFRLSDGRLIAGRSSKLHNLPEDKELSDVPYFVRIEYLVADPSVHRLIDTDDGAYTIGQWIKKSLAIPFLFFSFGLYCSYLILKDAYAKKERLKFNS